MKPLIMMFETLAIMMVITINGWKIDVSFKVPDTILMLLDMDLGTLSFMVDDRSVPEFCKLVWDKDNLGDITRFAHSYQCPINMT